MNRTIVAAAMFAVAGLSAAALGDGTVRVDWATNSNYGGPSFGGGGGFQATPQSGYIGEVGGNGGNASSFVTFCVEEGETFSPGGTYYGHLADRAVSGQASPGSGWDPVSGTYAATGSDPLSSTTALIYRTFRDGGDYGGSITGQADNQTEIMAIQQAIWFSEGEINSGDAGSAGGAFDTAHHLAWQIFNWAKSNRVDGEFYGVQVLQMWDSYSNGVGSGNHQDQLTLVPLPSAAYAGISSLAGVLGVSVVRRRRLSVV